MKYKIVTAVATEPVTTAEAKLHLKVTTSADDDLIDGLITAARETAEHYANRAFATATIEAADDEFPESDDDCPLVLPFGPVESVTSVTYTDTAGATQTVATSVYGLSSYGNARDLNLKLNQVWPSAVADIADAVLARYVTKADCPKAAHTAILLMVGFLYENRGDNAKIQPDNIQPAAARALLDTVRVYG